MSDALSHFDTWHLLALAGVLGFASGIRLYAVLFIVGIAGYFGLVELPPGLAVLAHPLVLAASGFMCAVEFFADKIPGVDTLWDVVHTLIRIPAGAALAASVFGQSSSAMMLAAAILGGSLAAGSHFTKATSRAVINTSPEPFSNWAASLTEDVGVGGLLWLAIVHPLVAGIVVLLLLVLLIVLLRHAWRAGRHVARRVGAILSRPPTEARDEYRHP
jgi:hypothetical protein